MMTLSRIAACKKPDSSAEPELMLCPCSVRANKKMPSNDL